MQNQEPPPDIPLSIPVQDPERNSLKTFYLSTVLDILGGLLKKSNTSINPTKPNLKNLQGFRNLGLKSSSGAFH